MWVSSSRHSDVEKEARTAKGIMVEVEPCFRARINTLFPLANPPPVLPYEEDGPLKPVTFFGATIKHGTDAVGVLSY